jgi:hypothetical protein
MSSVTLRKVARDERLSCESFSMKLLCGKELVTPASGWRFAYYRQSKIAARMPALRNQFAARCGFSA